MAALMPEMTRDQVLDALDRVLVVTVNQRLARSLLETYAQRQVAAGQSAWRQPRVLSWDLWQQRLLMQLGEDDLLLSEAQELHLWQQVVGDGLSDALRLQLQVPATARMARDAHHLLCQYGVDFPPHAASEDHRMFLTWREDYLQRLAHLKALDRGDLVHYIRKAFVGRQLDPPPEMILAGFDDLRPADRCLLGELETLGTVVHHWQGGDGRDAAVALASAEDPADEMRQCARWARAVLEQGSASVGIVIAEPHGYRGELAETLLSELAPQVLVEGGSVDGLMSFSLGSALADEGVVATALRLLALGRSNHFNDVSFVLRSPWVGDLVRERGVRMRLEAELREAGDVYWSPRALQDFRPRSPGAPRGVSGPNVANYLSGLATNLAKSLAEGRRGRAASDWSAQLLKLLELFGWPGQRDLDSRDYQAREEFFELFDELASLDRIGKPLTRSEAVAFLVRRAQERSFQVKETTGVVQVMGLLEAAGLTFEHLWVLGMHDAAFPAPPRPNPFIPVPLQRSHAMPHADAERELDFATQVATRLLSAAPQVVVSYPRLGEGGERQASPLVARFESSPAPRADSHDLQDVMQASRPVLESLPDRHAPPITANKPVTGGTGLLKDMALCPFRAFAHNRLRCEELTRLDIGLNNLQRGTLVHSLLECFWHEVKDLGTLRGLSADEREVRLRNASQKALRDLRGKGGRVLEQELRTIEEDRLVTLAEEWLEVELQRDPFTVEETEVSQVHTVGSLSIRTQVDRIDRLASGKVAIIDYKTGKPDPLKWLEPRISEPQLPVYVRDFPPRQIEAVLFAQVRSGECRFRGASDEETFPGVPDRRLCERLDELELDFQGLLGFWDAVLPQLADSYVAGEAGVDPLDAVTTCRYCDYPMLCRIREADPLGEGGADD